MSDKAQKITISVPASLAKAAENFAAIHTGGNLSRVFSDALRAHLSAHGALETQEEAKKRTLLEQLGEVYGADEISQMIAERTEAQLTGAECP